MFEKISYIYVSNFSFQFLNKTKNIEVIESNFSAIEKILNEYRSWDRFDIKCSSDILEYDPLNGLESLEYNLLSAADCDDNLFGYYLTLLEKTIGPYKSKVYTDGVIKKIQCQNITSFPRHYAYEFNSTQWPNINISYSTNHCKDTLNKNAEFIEMNHNGKDNFIDLCIVNFHNLNFHENIKSTLDTIKNGTYDDYKKWILLCLNTLNQSYNFISNDPQKNEDDLNPISDYTTSLGKHFSCTRQGKNKPFFIFDGDPEEVNCEYHFKINWTDNNQRLNQEDYLRIYFGLKFDEVKNRKSIKVAHIGCHYPY